VAEGEEPASDESATDETERIGVGLELDKAELELAGVELGLIGVGVGLESDKAELELAGVEL
jgi:hypothetical protein